MRVRKPADGWWIPPCERKPPNLRTLLLWNIVIVMGAALALVWIGVPK